MPVYTRTGDDGTTALFGGKRILKCEELVDVYGSIDELNSWIGVLLATDKNQRDKQLFLAIQQDLFLIGSVLAGWKGDISPLGKRILEMEQHIDAIETKVPKITNFILPGGSKSASYVHVVRSITRRVERQMVALFAKEKSSTVPDKNNQRKMITYINRLSDLLFMMARGINKTVGIKEVVWKGISTKSKE